MSNISSENNVKKIAKLYDVIQASLERTLKKGYYGKLSFEVSIQDGDIQGIEKQENEKYRV